MTDEQRRVALAHLGITYTQRGDGLTVDGAMPTDAALLAAYDEASTAPPPPTLQEQINDLRQRVDRAAQAAVSGDAAKVRDALKPTQ
jgi:hypothetical protein